MKIRLLCLAITAYVSSAFACANFSGGGTKYNGTSGKAYISGAAILRHAISKKLEPDGVAIEAGLHGSTNFNDRSDYSIALMYLGRNQEAVQLLESLEKEKPGEFFIAGNLGTAYELSGNNEAALRWINEEIKRNPDAHDGTEWLHAKILEAKIAEEKDADYFKRHSVLELRPETIGETITIGGLTLTPRDLAFAIEDQLGERLQFVKPPNAPVASLLFDYAAIEAATRTLESAKGVLKMALDYGYPPDKIEPLLKLYDQRIAWRKTKDYVLYVAIGIAFLALLFVLYKRGIFVLSSKDLRRK